MPGKYLEYIRAGRYVIPVELTFIPSKVGNKLTTKWVEVRHWREVRSMLKPAVESIAKHNEAGTDRISKSYHVEFGYELGFGYMIHLNKDKCPFLAVLDSKRNCWTDDEDVNIDENSGIADFGGRHKSYTPTKFYIKACILKKTEEKSNDRKSILKELGVKGEDMRNYLQSYPSDGVVVGLEKHKSKTGKKKDKTKKKRDEFDMFSRRDDSEESLMDLPPTTRTVSPLASTVREPVAKPATAGLESVDEIVDIDCEIIGKVGFGMLSDSMEDVFSSSSLFKNWLEDDPDLEELPDIEETFCYTAIKKGRKRKSRARSPPKSSMNFGLPDIDDNKKSKKRKRNVAVVEPMKITTSAQMSFEEAVGAMCEPHPHLDRKRKGRSGLSPTIERFSGSRFRNSAIEILGEDSELPNFEHATGCIEKKKRKNAVLRKPRKKRKRTNSAYLSRMTPSPFPEENSPYSEKTNSDSEFEPEMPVLTKMVNTSDEEREIGDDFGFSPLNSPSATPPFISEDGHEPGVEVEENPSAGVSAMNPTTEALSLSQPSTRVEPRSPIPDIVDDSSQLPQELPSLPSTSEAFIKSHLSVNQKTRRASDSDDITSEAAYRKTPIRKRRRKHPRLSCNSPTESLDSAMDTLHVKNASCQTTSFLPDLSPAIMNDSEISSASASTPKTVPAQLPSRQSLLALKRERCDNNTHSFDYIHRVFGDGDDDDDDDDVLFAGQFKAIPITRHNSKYHPVIPIDDDDEDDDLFSFKRPPPVKFESQSVNLVVNTAESIASTSKPPTIQETTGTVSATTPTTIAATLQVESEDEDDDFGARPHPCATLGGSQNVLNALHEKAPDLLQIEHEEKDATDNAIEQLTTFQLMNHPATLTAGFGFLNKVMSSKKSDMYRQLRIEKRDKKRREKLQQNDDELMPPPSVPQKRPVSPDICSLNPEQRLLRSKSRKEKKLQNSTIDGSGSSEAVPSTSAAAIRSENQSFEENISSGDEDHDSYHTESEPYFREFLSRAQEPQKQYEPQGDEYDLTQSSQCMLSVVQDYPEKSRRYKIHKKKIEELTIDQLKQYFEIIKPQILAIYEGKANSQRNELYCSKKHQDIRTLKSLHVIRPFTVEQGNRLTSWLIDLFVPQSGATLNCADYINYVMRPEALVRIFAYVNSITCDTAEKEMLAGACYEGPYLES